MEVTAAGKYLLCFPLWLVCLVSCVSVSQGQVDCDTDDVDQCEVGYYCASDYRCKPCALCENFQPVSPCAKSLLECGACLDGYEFLSIGKCAVQSHYSHVGTILLLVATGFSAVVLLILIFTIALYYIRRKRTKTYSCSNRLGLETGAVRNVAASPSAPEYPPAPPPYTSHNPQPAFNSLYNESSEPLLKTFISAPDLQLEGHQMAHPYSQCVRLPAGTRNYDGVDEIINENVSVEENIDSDDVINNQLPTSPSHHQPGVLLPVHRADPVTDSLPLHDMTISTQVQDSNTVSCMETVTAGLDGDDSEAGCSRPASPTEPNNNTGAGAGAQQVIVQFISNVSPVLNLLGKNTRR